MATSKYLPLGSSFTQQAKKRKRGVLGVMGGGRPYRKASVRHWLLPVTKEEKDSVSNGELRVRGTGDDRMVEGRKTEGWSSAPFESAIRKLGGVSGQTGLLR